MSRLFSLLVLAGCLLAPVFVIAHDEPTKYPHKDAFDLDAWFGQADEDGDGSLSKAEYLVAVEGHHDDLMGKIIHLRHDFHDIDQDGKVNFEEFAKMHPVHPDAPHYDHYIEHTQRQYQAADINGDGVIDADELRLVKENRKADNPMHKRLVEVTIQKMDKNGDGKLSVQEFFDSQSQASKEFTMEDAESEFERFLDKDGDGFATFDEMYGQLLKDIADEHGEHEQRFLDLFSEMDGDKNEKLTKDEMKKRVGIYQNFVESLHSHELELHDDIKDRHSREHPEL